MSQPATCYMCESPETSREHAPPSNIFPPFETLGRDVRRNLITVPSCDKHNFNKQMDDEHFRAQVVMQCAHKSNPAHKHFMDKFMRGATRKPDAYQSFFSPQGIVSDGEEIAIRFNRNRFDRSAECMVRALAFHTFRQKLLLPTMWIGSPQFYKAISNEHMVSDEYSNRMVEAIQNYLADAKAPDRGENPEIFRYRIAMDAQGGCAFAGLFYGYFELYAVAAPFMEMPRVYGLKALVDDPSNPDAYFQNFEDSVRKEPSKHELWFAREKAFQRLDPVAWEFLRAEAKPYVTKRDKRGRGYQQFISTLNMAWSYNYLLDEGCTGVRFIPRSPESGQKTPDLEGQLDGRRVLCEVKTIGISDGEARRTITGGVGTTAFELELAFLNKLHSTLLRAKEQIETYDKTTEARRVAFVVIDFDDFFAEYKSNYYRQIDQHLASHPIPGLEIVFYNQRTCIHEPIAMRHASVINE